MLLTRLADDDLARLLLIRHFEQALLELYERGELAGTTHTCLGQEYVPVAVSGLLGADDWVFSNHRGHGHYLARFDNPAGLLAEILGREGALCAGVGGSQHIRDRRYLSTGVQGESLPLAVGVALHLGRHEPARLACAYVGDGTWGEGAAYEALNMASLWHLPLLVVVEHNGIAQSTPTAYQLAGTISGRAAGFGVRHLRLESMDVNELRAQLAPPLDRMRRQPAPMVVEVATRRLGPHSKGDDTRPVAEVERLRETDWYHHYQHTDPVQFAAFDKAARARVAAVVEEVSARPLAAWAPHGSNQAGRR